MENRGARANNSPLVSNRVAIPPSRVNPGRRSWRRRRWRSCGAREAESHSLTGRNQKPYRSFFVLTPSADDPLAVLFRAVAPPARPPRPPSSPRGVGGPAVKYRCQYGRGRPLLKLRDALWRELPGQLMLVYCSPTLPPRLGPAVPSWPRATAARRSGLVTIAWCVVGLWRLVSRASAPARLVRASVQRRCDWPLSCPQRAPWALEYTLLPGHVSCRSEIGAGLCRTVGRARRDL